MSRFPRVLLITKSQVNDVDSAGAALRGWFKEWPKDRIAQVYSGVAVQSGDFIEKSYRLGPEDRRMGRLFFRLKGSELGASSQPYSHRATAGRRGIVSRCGRTLVETGAWELVFPPRLSSRLCSWLEDFQPEIIFAQGCDITFMRLPLMIGQLREIPIVFDVVDDWITDLYTDRLGSGPARRTALDAFEQLCRRSALRLTIGEAMADEYRRRYGLEFSALMQCDDQERFRSASPSHSNEMGYTTRIVYSGSLALGRWKALLDLDAAVTCLANEGLPTLVDVYAPHIPPEAEAALSAARCLRIRKSVPDDQIPGVLAGSDVLFLPESFDEGIRRYTRLSVSTKAHLYMMARRPILVYGPPEIGTIQYAKRDGWGVVVDREGVEGLASALVGLIKDPLSAAGIVSRADAVAARNHAGANVRARLRERLAEVAQLAGVRR